MPTPPIPWLERLDRLRVDRDEEKGRAPHKPLLLLAVLDLWEAGGLRDGWVECKRPVWHPIVRQTFGV